MLTSRHAVTLSNSGHGAWTSERIIRSASDPDGNLNVTPNSAASASTTGPLRNGAPVVKRRRKAYIRSHTSARPLAQGPKLMGDLSFDLTDVFWWE